MEDRGQRELVAGAGAAEFCPPGIVDGPYQGLHMGADDEIVLEKTPVPGHAGGLDTAMDPEGGPGRELVL